MPFLEFLFSPQAHKFRNGYFINHDTLMNVGPEARHKLIFYYIAEQLPQKLAPEDRISYQAERTRKIGVPRTIWMATALFAPLVYTVAKSRSNLRNPAAIAGSLIVGGLLAPFAVSLHTRIYEARFVQSNRLINKLSHKYKFGVYDFSVAIKQAHILNLLYTMDAPYEELHN